MFESNYYSLVAGLKEYALDAETKGFDSKEILDSILDQVTGSDVRTIELLYSYYDCENIVALRAGRSAHNPLGLLSREELEEQMLRPTKLIRGVTNVIKAFDDPEGEESENMNLNEGFERLLFEAYYNECAASSNRFVREWSSFDRNLRNIGAAIRARSVGRAIEEVTVGRGDVVEQLERSSAADFGLRGELSYIDGVIATINDEENLLEKERKMDAIRWNESSEIITFDYFNVNAILSYLTKINIVARWMRLDKSQGRAMFQTLISELDGKELVNKQ